jgi:hypothetical protein
MNALNDIQFPKTSSLSDTFDLLDKLVTDIILYIIYGVAVLCGFKFVLYLLNGFTSKSYMGPASLDDSPFRRRENWTIST